MTWPDRQGRARVHRVLQRGPQTRWPRQRFSRPQALCHVWTVRGFDIRLAWPLPGVHSEHPLACDPSGGEAQGESRVGPRNADATPSLRGGRVVGPGRKGAWRDSRRPASKGLGSATAYLRTSVLEEQAPNEAHPGRPCLTGTRSVSATGGPMRRADTQTRRQQSVCIGVHLWFSKRLQPQALRPRNYGRAPRSVRSA